MTIREEPGADAPRAVRASRSTTPPAATVTAELPVVRAPGGGPARPAGVPRTIRRRPAPVALRTLVWVLAFGFVVVTVGTIVATTHPNDLSVLWRTSDGPASASGTGATSNLATSTTLAGMREQSSTATAVTYLVPVNSYDLVLTVSAPTYVEERSPADSSKLTYAKTVPTGVTTIPVNGSASLVAPGRSPSALVVKVAGKVLGTVRDPRLGVTYTFEPQAVG